MLLAFHSRGRRAGKDTAAVYVEEWCLDHGYQYERRAFADKMKQLVAVALGLDPDSLGMIDLFKLEGHVAWSIGNKVRPSITGRDFIINIAGDSAHTGARGLFGAEFWIDQCLPLPQSTSVGWRPKHARGRRCITITDLRFPEEADRVHELGGLVVEVINPRATDAGGRSEQGLDPEHIDHKLYNIGSLQQLRTNVRLMMHSLDGTAP